MKVSRGTLLARLAEASIGVSSRGELLQQSNCFVFRDGKLTTFNDRVMVRAESPLGEIDAIVNASDFLGYLAKIPDDEIDIIPDGNELRIRNTDGDVYRKVGITCHASLELPIDSVPEPTKLRPIPDGLVPVLVAAARTCSNGPSAPLLTTVVHVWPEGVEAGDGFRFLRMDGPTGLSEILIPAQAIQAMKGLEVKRGGAENGWTHFKLASGSIVSLRSVAEPYIQGAEHCLKLDKPVEITLPTNLGEVLGRAEIFNDASFESSVSIAIGNGELTVSSSKDGGWFREKRTIPYRGDPIVFDVNPKFLVDILSRKRQVLVQHTGNSPRMKITADNTQFVVALKPRVKDD